MSDPLRIPPAIRMRFEQTAAEVCEMAKLDYADAPMRAREIVGHLEERWRELAEGNSSSEEAERLVLERFGKPERIAQRLRRPFLARLLIYRRYAAERLVAFLGASVCLCWVSVVEFQYRPELNGTSKPLFSLIFPESYTFFLTGLGSYGVGIVAVGAALIMRWKPAKGGLLGNVWFQARHALAIVPLLASLSLLTVPSYFGYVACKEYVQTPTYPVYLGCIAFSVIAGWLGGAAMISECLDIPGKLSRRRNRHAPFGMEMI